MGNQVLVLSRRDSSANELERQLTESGLTVHAVADYESAAGWLSGHTPACVLIQVPNADDADLCRELRRLSHAPCAVERCLGPFIYGRTAGSSININLPGQAPRRSLPTANDHQENPA